MGSAADLMLDGMCCEQCGEFLGGEPAGYPVTCDACNGVETKKESNRRWSTNHLTEIGVPFESHNNGIHLVVDQSIDFWPSTGKFIVRTTKETGRGIKNMLKALEKINA